MKKFTFLLLFLTSVLASAAGIAISGKEYGDSLYIVAANTQTGNNYVYTSPLPSGGCLYGVLFFQDDSIGLMITIQAALEQQPVQVYYLKDNTTGMCWINSILRG